MQTAVVTGNKEVTLMNKSKMVGRTFQICMQVSIVKSEASLKSLGASLKVKLQVIYIKSQVKSQVATYIEPLRGVQSRIMEC